MNTLLIRNILNTIFIMGALVGMYMYWRVSRETGTYVILAAMLVKFTESALRMLHKNE